MKVLLVIFMAAGVTCSAVGVPEGAQKEMDSLFSKFSGADPSSRRETAHKIAAFGDWALPGFIANLDNADPLIRAGSAQGLGILGRKAAGALPNLEGHLQDSRAEVRACSIDAINFIGISQPSIDKKIIRAMSDPDACVMLSALDYVADRALYDNSLRPEILPLLSSRDPSARFAAARVLANSTVLDKTYRIPLESLLQDPDMGTQAYAFVDLLNFKLLSDGAVARFIALCEKEDMKAIGIFQWRRKMISEIRFNQAESSRLKSLAANTRNAQLATFLNGLNLRAYDLAAQRTHNIFAKIFDVGNEVAVAGYNNYEMFADGHRELAIGADALCLLGDVLTKENSMLGEGGGWGNLKYSALCVIIFYPFTGLYDGYASSDQAKTARAWTSLGITAASIGFEVAFDLNSHPLRVTEGSPAPAKVFLQPVEGGGEMVASWRY